MQLDPIKPTLKAPGFKLLKLNYDKPLSNFAFKFNLRRYTQGNFRPGDWICNGCRAHNFASRSACFKCKVGNPQGGKGGPGSSGGGHNHDSGNRAPDNFRSGRGWQILLATS